MVVVGEEDIVEVNLSAWGVNRLEGVDKGLVEALDVVVIGRANDGGKGCLGIREEIFRIFRGGHGADNEEGAQGLERRSSWVKILN